MFNCKKVEYDLRLPELEMFFIPFQECKQINGHNGKKKFCSLEYVMNYVEEDFKM